MSSTVGGLGSQVQAQSTHAKRELRRALKKATQDPQGTIQSFAKTHSLHFMFSKALVN